MFVEQKRILKKNLDFKPSPFQEVCISFGGGGGI